MFNWKSHLWSVLGGLAHTHASAPLSEIQRILRGVLGVEDVSFYDKLGCELSGETTLQRALEQSCQVSVRLQCTRPADGTLANETQSVHTGGATESRFREGPGAAETKDLWSDERYDRFLREFLRLQQRHEFMWAGYIVRELLPRLGFAPEEAKIVLDRLRAENLVTISKVSNPKNPDFPATGVQLNRDHPHIKLLLGEDVHAERKPAELPPAEHLPVAEHLPAAPTSAEQS
jgi:hypothetical protein